MREHRVAQLLAGGIAVSMLVAASLRLDLSACKNDHQLTKDARGLSLRRARRLEGEVAQLNDEVSALRAENAKLRKELRPPAPAQPPPAADAAAARVERACAALVGSRGEGGAPPCRLKTLEPVFHSGADMRRLDPKGSALTDSLKALSRVDAPGDPARLQQALRKMASGKAVRIVVLGGSETAGVGCEEPEDKRLGTKARARRDCAWAARVGHWLQHSFPGASIAVENLARGGTTTRVVLASLATILGDKAPPDIVLTDFACNDAHEVRPSPRRLSIRSG